jgi:hypothetical protein
MISHWWGKNAPKLTMEIDEEKLMELAERLALTVHHTARNLNNNAENM